VEEKLCSDSPKHGRIDVLGIKEKKIGPAVVAFFFEYWAGYIVSLCPMHVVVSF
jgi:hypothetical protein